MLVSRLFVVAGVSLAHDLRERGVSVALLHPGFVATDMTGGRGNVEPAEAAAGLLARLDDLQACVLRQKLPYADADAQARRDAAALYDRLLHGWCGLPEVVLSEVGPGEVAM